MLVSCDLSQIEVVCFAYFTKDKTLCRLLKDGLDVHEYMLLQCKGIDKDHTNFKEERKAIKAVTFGIIYGNGPFKLSETLKIDQDMAKDYIDTFYKTFPGSKTWHSKIIREVEYNGFLITPTSRILKFKKFPGKFDWQDKGKLYYNPPDIKNWPVQSFAHDIYALFLGKIFRSYLKLSEEEKKNIKLINTIHDSYMLDVHPDHVQTGIKLITDVLDKYEDIIYNQYKIAFQLPIRYEISSGESWADLEG